MRARDLTIFLVTQGMTAPAGSGWATGRLCCHAVAERLFVGEPPFGEVLTRMVGKERGASPLDMAGALKPGLLDRAALF